MLLCCQPAYDYHGHIWAVAGNFHLKIQYSISDYFYYSIKINITVLRSFHFLTHFWQEIVWEILSQKEFANAGKGVTNRMEYFMQPSLWYCYCDSMDFLLFISEFIGHQCYQLTSSYHVMGQGINEGLSSSLSLLFSSLDTLVKSRNFFHTE